MVKYNKINPSSVLSTLQQRSNSDVKYFEIISADEQDAELMECEVGDAIIFYHNNRDDEIYMEML